MAGGAVRDAVVVSVPGLVAGVGAGAGAGVGDGAGAGPVAGDDDLPRNQSLVADLLQRDKGLSDRWLL